MSISVITICFNNLEEVKKTCFSVDQQTLRPAEHWIINGSTNSAIAEWLDQTPQPAYRKWINERDKGIADAFNKGIQSATGDIIHLLNSGDIYTSDDVLHIVTDMFDRNPDVRWISGKIKLLRGGHWVEVGKPFEKGKLYRGMRSVSHPAWFVKKEVYDRSGLYNLSYSIAMDYDMMCRIANEPYLFLNKTLVEFDPTGISSENYLAGLEQSKAIYESHFGYSVKLGLWQLRLRILYHLLQSPIGKILYTVKRKAGLANV